MEPVLEAIYDGAAAVVLLGAVISAAQWLLMRWYGEEPESGYSERER